MGAGQGKFLFALRISDRSLESRFIPCADMTKPKTIGDYLGQVADGEKREALEQLREVIRGAAPGAEEYISYGLAAFRVEGKPLVAFGAAEKHCAFYLMSGSTVEAYKEELTGYDTSKGTIRFQPSRPLPKTLVRKLVKARMAENVRKG